jgi:hypothetical protein
MKKKLKINNLECFAAACQYISKYIAKPVVLVISPTLHCTSRVADIYKINFLILSITDLVDVVNVVNVNRIKR